MSATEMNHYTWFWVSSIYNINRLLNTTTNMYTMKWLFLGNVEYQSKVWTHFIELIDKCSLVVWELSWCEVIFCFILYFPAPRVLEFASLPPLVCLSLPIDGLHGPQLFLLESDHLHTLSVFKPCVSFVSLSVCLISYVIAVPQCHNFSDNSAYFTPTTKQALCCSNSKQSEFISVENVEF